MKSVKKFALVSAVLLSLSGVFPGRVFASDLAAAIRECVGDVQVKNADSDWVPARPGMALQGSSLISTGFRSNAILAIGNSTIRVRPLSRLSLDDLVAMGKDEQIGLGLHAGRVHADVSPPAGGKIDFKVISPMVTASVRGTTFDFSAIDLVVYSGVVFFTGGDRTTVIVTPGKVASIDSQGRSASPVTITEQTLSHVGAGAAIEPPIVSGPVSPVIAGPDGVISVPGIIGGAGSGLSDPSSYGFVEIDLSGL
ncbi:MAG: FecR domain-containing protein [Treponema sp.]|jgi:hypothetical protein|nr:FecR domain-containing protein [Treponema sp.]